MVTIIIADILRQKMYSQCWFTFLQKLKYKYHETVGWEPTAAI